jgi:hypothetical protein
MHRVAQADDRPVRHHLPVEIPEEELGEREPPVGVAPGERPHQHDARRHGQHRVRERERDHADAMHRRGPSPGVTSEPVPPRHPQHARRERGPHIPVGDVQRQEDVKRLRALGEERDVVVGLKRGEDPEHRRDAEDADETNAPGLPLHLRTIRDEAGRVNMPVSVSRLFCCAHDRLRPRSPWSPSPMRVWEPYISRRSSRGESASSHHVLVHYDLRLGDLGFAVI